MAQKVVGSIPISRPIIMSVDYKVPFYSNTPDDTHCVQACYKMVLKYFLPNKDFSWEELDKATAKQKDMWTWPMAGLIWLQEQGLEIINIEDFDYGQFIKNKKNYLIEKYGRVIADKQEAHSNIPAELKWARQFIKKMKTDSRIPDCDDIKHHLDMGYLVIVSVNYNSLHHKKGYTGHSVVIKGYDDQGFIIHDPGNPGEPDFRPSYDQFMKGWAYPNEGVKNMTGLKLKGDNG